MIVKNEEKMLAKSISSISFLADEIIIVDTGSTDQTKDIAYEFTDKVYDFTWIDDFSAARNFVQSFASCDYIIRWDADFVMPEKYHEAALDVKRAGYHEADLVYFTWNIECDGEVPLKSVMNFFVYRKEVFYWESPIHNRLVLHDESYRDHLREVRFPEIEVNHYKDPVDKSHRYAQTQKILETELSKDPDNLRLRIYLAENLRFTGRFQEAILEYRKILRLISFSEEVKVVPIVEQYVHCLLNVREMREAYKIVSVLFKNYSRNPRVILMVADLMYLQGDDQVVGMYQKYLDHPIRKGESLGAFDLERHYVHPRLMVSILGGEKSQVYAQEAYQSTTRAEVRQALLAQFGKEFFEHQKKKWD
jgi:glycosyltransferase involved in cell wall biosynthesis